MSKHDEGYGFLITIILNLNHDRYKSYFNYFLVLHIGIFTTMASDFAARIHLSIFLPFIGGMLSIFWFLILFKIQKDIEAAWCAINAYEGDPSFSGAVKVGQSSWGGCYFASKIMLGIPALFFVSYGYILCTHICFH